MIVCLLDLSIKNNFYIIHNVFHMVGNHLHQIDSKLTDFLSKLSFEPGSLLCIKLSFSVLAPRYQQQFYNLFYLKKKRKV